MEAPTWFSLLLCVAVTASASNQTCDPKVEAINPWVSVKEMLTGCWTNFVTPDQAEVHILNLKFKSENAMFNLRTTSDRPMKLILTSTVRIYGLYNVSNNVEIYINNDSKIGLLTNGHHKNVLKQDFPTEEEALVEWTKLKFGGVTSFTTIKNPQYVTLTEAQGTKPGSLSCTLEYEDSSERHFMRIETNPTAPSLKTCSPPQSSTEPGIHIVNIPESSNVRNVSLHIETKPSTRLFLRGPAGTTWTFLNAQFTSLASNNGIRLPNISPTIKPTIEFNSDDAGDVQRKTLEHFKATSFTSYTELRLDESAVALNLEIRDIPTATESVIETTTITKNNAPSKMPLLMHLYTSPDYRSPLDPSTKLQCGKRIYAEISGHTYGMIQLNIEVETCVLRSKGSCDVARELNVKAEACSSSPCPNSTRFTFSLDPIQELTATTWEMECSVKICFIDKCGDGGIVKRSLEVTQPCQQPQIPRCLEFGLPGVLGVAFGGFLIGVLLMGALWFIKIKTGYPTGLDMSATAASLPGCPCSGVKRQQVSTNPSPSENSSANASIGSTQSTPTSSMA